MAVTIESYENSFVTFTDQSNLFISDRSCAFQRDFCLPLYDNYDIQFLIKLTSTISYGDVTDFLTMLLKDECGGATYPESEPAIAPTFTVLDEVSVGYDTEYIISVSFPDGWSYTIDAGDCIVFNVRFNDGDGNTASVCSNCFIKIDDKCFTTFVKYSNSEDAFGFPYSSIGGFLNYVRLPMWLSKPQYPKTGEFYERSDGTKQTLFARFNRQYTVIADDMPEWWMKNLLIAISHDTVAVVPEDSNVLGTGVINVVSNNDWEIDWPDMGVSSANWGRPRFTLLETPYMEINNNCS